MEEVGPSAAGPVKKWHWLGLPFVVGAILILAVLVAAMMNEWVLVTVDDRHERYLSPSIATDAQGNRHILFGYYEGNPTEAGIVYRGVNDQGAVEIVLEDGRHIIDGDIVVDSLGNPHFLYSSFVPFVNQAGPYDLTYSAVENGTVRSRIVDTFSGIQVFAFALDSSNNPHVVYTDSTDIVYSYMLGDDWKKQNMTSMISYAWPFSIWNVNFGLSISVDSNDIPHIAAVIGSYVVLCDLQSNGTWSATRWASYDIMGNHIDIASDSEGDTYVVFQAPVASSGSNSSSGWIHLGTLTSEGSWSFRPYIDLSIFGDFRNYGDLELAIDENDDLVVTGSFGYPSKLFYQTDGPGGVANGTIPDPDGDFWSNDMAIGRGGHIFLIGSDMTSILMLTNTASLGARMGDLGYSLLLGVAAGTSFVVGIANLSQLWWARRRRERK